MKMLRKTALLFAMSSLVITQTGCFGEFALTRKVWEWNDDISDSKFVKTLLFYVMNIIPVYGIAAFVDVVILNLIEFWSGSNPMSMNEGDYEMQMATVNGEQFKLEATKDTFTTTQLTGEKAGEVRVMKFDRSDMTWKYSDSKVCDQPVVGMLDKNGENVRVFTAAGEVEMAAADMADKDVVMAKFNATKGLVTASAN